MKILKNNSGSTLTELVASLPLGILVFLILTIVLINFMTSYQETRLYTQLQEELFNAVETIRHGFIFESITGNHSANPEQKKELIGLMTAQKVTIGTSRNSMEIFPTNLQGVGWVKKSKFYLSSNKDLKVDLTYPLSQSVPQNKNTIFPKSNRKIGKMKQFQITNNDLFSIVKGSPEKPEIIGIHLVGQVRFREKGKKQSTEEDLHLNTKTADFYTEVFLGNIK